MSTAIGDLVVNLGMNTVPFGEAVGSAQGQMVRLNQSVEMASGSSHGLYRAETALAHGVEMVGRAIGTQNAALGELISRGGESIAVIGMSTHSYVALGKIIAQVTLARVAETAATIAATVAEAAFWLVSNPVGWAIIAAGSIAAALGYAYFANSAGKAAEELAKLNDEREKSIEHEIKRSMGSVGVAQADLRQQQQNYERVKGAEQYQVAGQTFYTGADSASLLVEAKRAVTDATLQLTQAENKEVEAATALAAKNEEIRGDQIASQFDSMWNSLAKLTMTAQEFARFDFIKKFKPSDTILAMWDSLAEKIEKATKAAALTKGIADAEKSAREALATFGLSSERRQLWQLQQQGATPQQLKKLGVQADIMEELKAGEKARGAGAALAQQLMTPLEQYTKKLADYQRLFSVGAIDKNILARANAAALAEYQGKQGTPELPKPHEFGAEGTFAEILRLTGQTPEKEKWAEQTAENTGRMAAVLEKQDGAAADEAEWDPGG